MEVDLKLKGKRERVWLCKEEFNIDLTNNPIKSKEEFMTEEQYQESVRQGRDLTKIREVNV